MNGRAIIGYRLVEKFGPGYQRWLVCRDDRAEPATAVATGPSILGGFRLRRFGALLGHIVWTMLCRKARVDP